MFQFVDVCDMHRLWYSTSYGPKKNCFIISSDIETEISIMICSESMTRID